MLDTSFAPWPAFTVEEVDAVSRVLLSGKVNYWTGTEGREFEKEFARWTGCEYAIAVANGTLALDLALRALNVGACNGGCATDEVIVTPRSFLASASCVVNAGAVPVFADVDRDSGNIQADSIREVMTEFTKAVIPVHLAGWPCEMEPIMELAAEASIHVIEDCAQAHGAIYKGRPVGSIGHIGAWSFCQDKIMTTGGEGGMVTCNDRDLWSTMWSYKDHGKSWSAVYERDHPPGFRWLHESFGTNWRLTEMQSAIGRIQLRRMADWQAARSRNAETLFRALAPFGGQDGPIRVPRIDPGQNDTRHAHYKLYAYLRPENLRSGWTRDKVLEQINAAGVPAYQGSCSEMYLEKAFDGTPFRPHSRLPVARELGDNSLMFLVHPTLTAEQMARAGDVIAKVLGEAAR
jgi:dTDP-4-amino-4,6-dideoxygalactose transaminase